MDELRDRAPITAWLQRWRDGDRSVETDLVAAIYPLLRDLARQHARRNGPGCTLQSTDLANEAYLRLNQQQSVDWQNRDHFYAIAATVLRRVVIDYLRQRSAEKRGAGLQFVPLQDLDADEVPMIDADVDWLAVDAALTALAQVDADCARVVEMRVFSGLTVERIATACGSSVATVGRQWRFARAWLADQLGLEA